jgi:hypothetical protein
MKRLSLVCLILAVLTLPAYPLSNDNQAIYNKLDEIKNALGGGASSTSFTDGSHKTQVTKQVGAANLDNGQVAASTTAGTLIAARATRRSATIKNTDAAITVYVGKATVTAANGMEIKAGQSINIDTTALIQVIAASGTPSVAYIETYD